MDGLLDRLEVPSLWKVGVEERNTQTTKNHRTDSDTLPETNSGLEPENRRFPKGNYKIRAVCCYHPSVSLLELEILEFSPSQGPFF